MARRQYKLGQRACLSPEPPFTPDKLQRLIGDALGDRYAPPEDAEAEKLCRILNHWHAWFYKAQEQRYFNAVLEEAKAAIEKLQVVLPVIVNHHLAQAERGDPFARWQAEAAVDLLIAVREDPQRVTHHETLPEHVRDWRWLAEVLPTDIEKAMRPANPRFPPGHSKGGPVSRILQAVIPLITGESVTANAIGNQLIILARGRREKPTEGG
jgi:hypothetical protein